MSDAGATPACVADALGSAKRVNRAVYAAFITLAAAFVLSSTVQIARAVFTEPAAPAAADAVSDACAVGLRALAAAVDRGVVAASSAHDRADAENRYRAARSPEWDPPRRDDLVRACAADRAGADALAAITRLDQAAEGAVGRHVAQLGPVRRAVDSYIR